MRLLKRIVLGLIGGIFAVYLLLAIGLTVLEWIVRENPKVEESLRAQPAQSTDLGGGKPRWGLHAKRGVIDGDTTLLGTYNIDPTSPSIPQRSKSNAEGALSPTD